MRCRCLPIWLACWLYCSMGLARAGATEVWGFQSDIQPLLRQYCFDCHGDGAEEGGMRLDVARRG